jgi:hypothetical protein
MIAERPDRGRAALVALSAGAAGSLALLFHAGRGTPRLLLVLMALWVLSPFALLLAARAAAARWPAPARQPIDAAGVAVALLSPALYAAATFGAFLTRPTPAFVLVPPLSCVLVAAVAVLAARGRRA